jgi:hypothetical protein
MEMKGVLVNEELEEMWKGTQMPQMEVTCLRLLKPTFR